MNLKRTPISLGQADIIRRAMSKKHLDELEAAKDGFVSGFKAKGAKDADIEKFWNELLDFAKYAFNKSHAAAYSVLSYYTAWLKHYYPVEYLASLMSFSTKEDVGLYVKNAKDYGVKVLPPDVNRSLHYTAPTRNGEIRFGLEGLKDVGAAAEKIVRERKTGGAFKSLDDFVLRCVIIGVDKAPIESLVKAGALDEFVYNRQEAVENIAAYVTACRTAIRSAFKKAEEQGIEPDSRWVYNTINAEKEFKQLRSLQETREFAEKLREENAQLKAKASEIDSWKESFRKREYALKEQVASLTKQLEDAQAQISELRIPMDTHKDVVSLDDALREAGFEDIGQEPKLYHDELTEYEQRYRIIIAGGNENLMKKFRTTHHDIVIINYARIANCEAVVRNADILLFKTDCISHSLYDKCKDIANTCKVPYGYIPETTSINLIEQIICEKIAEKLSTRREVGIYA